MSECKFIVTAEGGDVRGVYPSTSRMFCATHGFELNASGCPGAKIDDLTARVEVLERAAREHSWAIDVPESADNG